MDRRITGKMFFRQAGSAARLGKPYHTLFMAISIIAIPNDELPLDESFGVVIGETSMTGSLLLAIHPTGEQHEETIGNTPDGILTEPFWQI